MWQLTLTNLRTHSFCYLPPVSMSHTTSGAAPLFFFLLGQNIFQMAASSPQSPQLRANWCLFASSCILPLALHAVTPLEICMFGLDTSLHNSCGWVRKAKSEKRRKRERKVSWTWQIQSMPAKPISPGQGTLTGNYYYVLFRCTL